VASVLALRTLGLESQHEAAVCVAWICLSWCCRRCQVTLWSLGFIILELGAARIHLSARVWSTVFILQIAIVIGFWSGIIGAAFKKDSTIHPLDRHLRLGFSHLMGNPAAFRVLLHEGSGHLLTQVLMAFVAAENAGDWPGLEALPTALAAFGVYVCCALAAASAVPPHGLPYLLGTLPKRLCFPLHLPAWLQGRGADGDLRKFRTLWWMEHPVPGGKSA